MTDAPRSSILRRPAGLCCLGVVLLLLTVLGAEATSLLRDIHELGHPWRGALWVSGGLAVTGLIWLICREVAGYLRLGRVEALQRRLAAMDAEDVSLAAAVDRWMHALRGQNLVLDQAIDVTRRSIQGHTHVALIRAQLCETLMPVLDERVEQAVRREALRTGVLTSITPLPGVDAIIALWRSTRLVRVVATMHGARPGMAGTMRLVRETCTAALAADVSQHAADAVSARIGTLGAATGQGVIVATMVARVGLWAQFVCRPVTRPRRALSGFVARGAAHELRDGCVSGWGQLRRLWRRHAATPVVASETPAPATTTLSPSE